MDTQQAPPQPAYEGLAAFVERVQSPLIPNLTAAQWQLRKHRDKLIKAGVLIPGRGRRETIVDRDRFLRELAAMMQSEAIERAS